MTSPSQQPSFRWPIPSAFDFLFAKSINGLPARYKFGYGGRGGAKTETYATAQIALSYQQPHFFLNTRELQMSIEDSVHKTIANRIHELKLTSDFTITKTGITNHRTRSEWAFYGIASNVGKIKSIAGVTVCWLEEAHNTSEESWDILDPSIRAANSQMWISMNPNEASDYLYQHFVVGPPPPDAIVRKVNYYDNPWFASTVLERQRQNDANKFGVESDKYKHKWLGEPKGQNDAIIFNGYTRTEDLTSPLILLPNPLNSDHQPIFVDIFGEPLNPKTPPTSSRIDPNPLTPILLKPEDPNSQRMTDLTIYPSTWDGPYFGIDWGFSISPTAASRSWVIYDTDPPTYYIEYESYTHKLDLDKTAPKFNRDIPDMYRYQARADCARPETISYMQRQGYPNITPVTKWAGSVEDGIEHLKAYCKIVIHPRCVNMQREAGLYQYKVDRAGNVLKTIIDAHNDLWDTCRYGIQPRIKSFTNQGLVDHIQHQRSKK